MARRKLVSGNQASCALHAAAVWRQVAISIQAVMAPSVPTSQNRPLPTTPERRCGKPVCAAPGRCRRERRHPHTWLARVSRATTAWPCCAGPAACPPAPGSAVEQGHCIARQHFGGGAVAQQAVDGVFSPSTTPLNLPWLLRGTCSCSSGRRRPWWLPAGRKPVAAGPRQAKVGVGRFSWFEHFTCNAQPPLASVGGLACADASAVVNPGDGLQFGGTIDQGLGAV